MKIAKIVFAIATVLIFTVTSLDVTITLTTKGKYDIIGLIQ